MLARCGGLFSNADSRDATLPPTPTFSPDAVHPAGNIEPRLPLCEIVPAAAIWPAHQSPRLVSRGSTASGATPRLARTPLIAPTKAIPSDKASAWAGAADVSGANTAADI